MSLLCETPSGLYCQQGDFYVDPWRPVGRAVITHAHADHARAGCQSYLAAKSGDAIFRLRLGDDANIQFANYGETVELGGVQVSLHPAGHMTGSAQVRLEHRGRVEVVSGDYKLQSDPTCPTFEPIRCHRFVTESTFGLPIYRWPQPTSVFEEINCWWKNNQSAGRASVLFGYSIGKAQRLLSGVDPEIGPIFGHGAILNAVAAYRQCDVQLPEVHAAMGQPKNFDWSQSLIVAPPSARGSTWLRRFGNVSLGMASGWMRVRGVRRRRAIDRGFVLSDHVDWLDLLSAVKETEAEEVWVTHGYTKQVVSHLQQMGLDSREVQTQFRGELDIEDPVSEEVENIEEGGQ